MKEIVDRLKSQRDRLNEAISLLESIGNDHGFQETTRHKARRVISKEARDRIRKAQQERWAKWRKERGK